MKAERIAPAPADWLLTVLALMLWAALCPADAEASTIDAGHRVCPASGAAS